MYPLNRAKIIGYVTEKPELRTIPSGTSVCDVNLRCISKVKKDDGTSADMTSFHNVTFWAKQAEIISQYSSVGSQLYIEGRLQTDSWDGEDGKKRYKTKVIGEDFSFLMPKDGGHPSFQSPTFATGINSVELIGNLTKDVEVRQTPNGRSVGSTSVATNRKRKDQSGQYIDETEFHNVVLWNDLASEGESQLKKGRKVYMEGRLQTRSWETPEGVKRYTTEVIVEKVALLGSEAPVDMNAGAQNAPAAAPQKTSEPEQTAPSPSIQYESDIKPEDLPF